MGDLVAVFRAGGVVEQFGPPAEILAAPASPFVARFVGRGPRAQAAVADARQRPGAGTGRHGARRRRRRRRPAAHAGRPVPVPAAARRRRPAAGLGRRAPHPRGRPRSTPRSSRRRRRCSTGGPRSRTRCRCCSTRDVQAGVVVDRARRRTAASSRRADRRLHARHGRGRRPARRCRRRPPTSVDDPAAAAGSTGPGCAATTSTTSSPTRLVQHLCLTLIAIVVGFVISFALSVWSRPPAPRLRADHRRSTGILYTIPSLALFALLVPITGLSLLTAEIPLDPVHAADLRPQHVAGFDAVPPDVREAADGMGYTRRAAAAGASSCRSPCR